MISITIGNKQLLLNKNAKIKLVYRNPNFEDAFTDKAFTLPFEAPLVGINIEIFGFEQMPNFTSNYQEETAYLFYKGIPFLKGKIITLSNNRDSIKLSFKVDTDFVELPDLNVNEINLGGDRTLGADADELRTYAKDNLALSYPDVDFNFPPIYNPSFLPSTATEFSKILNRFGTRFDEVFPKNGITFPRADCLVPQPFVMYIIKQIFAEIGYTIAGAFVDDVDMQKLMIYANHALDGKTTITLYPENAKATLTAKVDRDTDGPVVDITVDGVSRPFLIGEFITDYPELFKTVLFNDETTPPNYDNNNHYTPATGKYKITTVKEHTINYVLNLAPYLYGGTTSSDAAYLKLQEYYVCVWCKVGTEALIEGEFYSPHTNAEMYTILAASSGVYNINKTFSFTPTAEQVGLDLEIKVSVFRKINIAAPGDPADWWYGVYGADFLADSFIDFSITPDVYNVNDYNPVYNMQNSAPLVKCKDFVKAFKDAFNLAFIWDTEKKICHIEYFDALLMQASTTNWSKKAGYQFEKKQKSFSINGLKYAFPDSDEFAKVYDVEKAEYNTDGATEVITIKATPLGYIWANSRATGGSVALIPAIDQSGNSGFDGSTTNNRANIRTMYYRGATADSVGNTYYKALAINADINGARTTEKTLEMNSDYGIVKNYYKNYMHRFNNSAEYTRSFLLNILDLKSLNTSSEFIIDYGKYTLKELSVEIGEQIEEAEATLLKID